MAESLGLKTQFQREGATQGTYETVASVASIQPPQYAVDVAEIEDLDPPDAIKKKLPGLIDAGEVTLTLNFDPDDAGQTALETDLHARATRNYRIKLPSGDGWTFPAFISGWAPQEITAGDVIQVEVTLTVTGKPTFGAITL
ncbi:MAG: phage tail tube protein [Bacillota bacterium]